MNYQLINRVMATIYPNWLGPAFRVLNTVRGALWTAVQEEDLRDNYRLLSVDSPFRDFPVDVESQLVCDSFKAHNKLAQKEYLLSYPDELVHEPKYGWAMTRAGGLIIDSLPYTYYALVPGLRDYVRVRLRSQEMVTAEKLASLRDVGDKNYYHFYNDHLVKLALLEKMGLGLDVPLLVSRVLFTKPFFQEALERGGLKKRSWIVQDTEYVVSKKSFFVKTMPVTREYLEYVLTMLNAPKPNPNKQRRIFIDRGKSVGRCISNISEIRGVLSGLDFESVILDGLSLAAQMELFSEAGMVVGIHGAALANIIFRAGAPLQVVEIFPPNNIPAMFYWTSCRFGFRYDAVVGEKNDWKRADRQQWAKVDFYVDPEKLRKVCLKMLGKRD